ncbi:hypothetical protein CIW54_08210 [Paraburkholderia sp. T12-10]|nr:hypothetical protein CIW54_08210 [Paraburkholderia sp. T12-10]
MTADALWRRVPLQPIGRSWLLERCDCSVQFILTRRNPRTLPFAFLPASFGRLLSRIGSDAMIAMSPRHSALVWFVEPPPRDDSDSHWFGTDRRELAMT